MYAVVLAKYFGLSGTAFAMCCSGILTLLIAVWAARTDFVHARGIERIVTLASLCYAVPLVIFGALHLWGVDFVLPLVPRYMPVRIFWAYFVGVALVAAGLSVATKIQVRWSGLLVGIMLFLFVAMLDIPGSLSTPADRFGWTVLIRESSFAGGGWILAGCAMRSKAGSRLITVGRVCIAIAAMFFGVEHFLHPANCPGVPLEKLTPAWIPGRLLMGYLTGAILLIAGAFILIAKRTRLAATYLGAWLLLLVIFIYGPILFVALADPNAGVEVEGINYFADTLLFAGAILALAGATPRMDECAGHEQVDNAHQESAV